MSSEMTRDEITTDELLAKDLLEKARASNISIDALLALLAYSVHGETAPLTEAREKGAQIGPIQKSGWQLRQRALDALHNDETSSCD
jgi:hypothetical protein